MRRRDFICSLSAAAAAVLPRAARAQNAERMARIGYLTPHPPGAEETALTDGLHASAGLRDKTKHYDRPKDLFR
jgi:hypothetical protein